MIIRDNDFTAARRVIDSYCERCAAYRCDECSINDLLDFIDVKEAKKWQKDTEGSGTGTGKK